MRFGASFVTVAARAGAFGDRQAIVLAWDRFIDGMAPLRPMHRSVPPQFFTAFADTTSAMPDCAE